MSHADLVISDVRPWGGEARDLVVSGTAITGVVPPGTAPGADRTVDGRGLLALPGLVNAHAHVDKSWWGLPWQPYDGAPGVAGRIAHERDRRGDLGIPGVEPTSRVLAEMVRHGTTALRTHVDVDLGLGLRGLEVVAEAVAAYDGALSVETVAFPQDGVLRRPGVLDLLDRAAAAGADHVGGLDPATIDRDPSDSSTPCWRSRHATAAAPTSTSTTPPSSAPSPSSCCSSASSASGCRVASTSRTASRWPTSTTDAAATCCRRWASSASA